MPTPSILILTDDRFHADVLSQTVSSVSPNVRCVESSPCRGIIAAIRIATGRSASTNSIGSLSYSTIAAARCAPANIMRRKAPRTASHPPGHSSQGGFAVKISKSPSSIQLTGAETCCRLARHPPTRQHTVQVTGRDAGAGIALIEIYEVP
jgi:hypothetical protein